VVRFPIQLGVRRARLTHQNAAVVQACVPVVELRGDSYRLKDKDLGGTTPTQATEPT
jgi:hypothetical protein